MTRKRIWRHIYIFTNIRNYVAIQKFSNARIDNSRIKKQNKNRKNRKRIISKLAKQKGFRPPR